MPCVKCGKQTESGVYVCDSCITDTQSESHFAESLVVYPSLINDLSYGESTLLRLESPKNAESMKLFEDDLQKQKIPYNLTFQTDDLSEDSARLFLEDFKRTLINMGLALDLDGKPLSILTSGDIILSEHVLLKVSEIDNMFPDFSDIDLNLLIGNFHYTLYRANSATATIDKRERHLQKALEYYDRALGMNAESVYAWKNKARVLLDLGETDEAVQCFDWVLSHTKPPESDIMVLLRKGLAMVKAEKFDEALRCFDKVLDKDPANMEAWRKKGDVFSKTNRWGGAIQCYSEAVKHAPHREDIWIAMSETYINHGKFKDASRCLDEVLKINIWSSDAWYLQGIVFSKIDRWGAAVQCLDKSISINPINIKAWKARGDLFMNTNRYEEALACYEKGLLIQPKNPQLLISKVKSLKTMGRFDEALDTLKILEAQNKDNPDVPFEMGDILQETGKAYKALKSFDSAIELKPDFAEAFFKKGQTLEKLRRYSEAIVCYEKTLELKPKFEAAQVALRDCMMKMDGK
jgi:tetratricopeptide (TPR) repeat protein